MNSNELKEQIIKLQSILSDSQAEIVDLTDTLQILKFNLKEAEELLEEMELFGKPKLDISENGLTVTQGVLFRYYGPESEVVIPDGVIKIGERAFAGCRRIESVVMPESLKEIGNCAFQGCLSLKSITLTNRLEKIGYQAFTDCPELSEIKGSYTVKEGWLSAFETMHPMRKMLQEKLQNDS